MDLVRLHWTGGFLKGCYNSTYCVCRVVKNVFLQLCILPCFQNFNAIDMMLSLVRHHYTSWYFKACAISTVILLVGRQLSVVPWIECYSNNCFFSWASLNSGFVIRVQLKHICDCDLGTSKARLCLLGHENDCSVSMSSLYTIVFIIRCN